MTKQSRGYAGFAVVWALFFCVIVVLYRNDPNASRDRTGYNTIGVGILIQVVVATLCALLPEPTEEEKRKQARRNKRRFSYADEKEYRRVANYQRYLRDRAIATSPPEVFANMLKNVEVLEEIELKMTQWTLTKRATVLKQLDAEYKKALRGATEQQRLDITEMYREKRRELFDR